MNATVAPDLETACRAAQVIITTTPAKTPLIARNWIAPGTHITAVGADSPGKQELATDLVTSADLLVCDLAAQSLHHGEFATAEAEAGIAEDVVALGSVLSGAHPGRADEAQITIADLTGLAVLSGAIGVGLGFGLQKVVSNLVSGVIILLDKSIKPGDVIEIEGSFGWINSIRTRYISVITRDRKEILIPNEDFVTNKVVNWSFTDRIVRIKADVGVSYNADVPEAIRICTEAASQIPRVLTDPAPSTLLMEFGDSSINLQVRFWIEDAPQGVSNIRSEVLLAVWQAFRDNNIEIPFPQRDLHIKSGNLPLPTDH